MHLTLLFTIFSALITKIFSAGIIIETPKPDRSELVEATINILKSCYEGRISTVGLAGFSFGDISKMMILREFLAPVILIHDNSRIVNNGSFSRVSQHKLQVFVVAVTGSSNLTKTLIQIKNTIWWNHMASFFLLDSSASRHQCSKAKEILWQASKMNVLNSQFMCLNRSTNSLIYTYNPYTNKAAAPWQLVNTFKLKNYDKWTLFMRVYRDDKDICDGLDFDKTIDLEGYKINAYDPQLRQSDLNITGNPVIRNRLKYIVFQTLIAALNATVHYSSIETLRDISDIHFSIKNYDIMTPQRPTTYPFITSGLTIITQYRGYMSQIRKIISVLDVPSRFGLLLVCLITLLFFKCYLRQPLMSAILNIILVTLNASLQNVPTKLATRIYLGSLFLFLLTIQGIYQGKLASLLANEKSLPNANNIEDLVRSDYTINVHNKWKVFFNYSDFQGRYVEQMSFDCTHLALRDYKQACIGERFFFITDAVRYKLHMSHETIATLHTIIPIRIDWPLEKRVNTILKRCFEGDLIVSTIAYDLKKLMYIIQSRANDQDQYFKVLDFEKLKFAFVILGIGLGCAILCFIVEIGTVNAFSKIAKVQSFIRRLVRK